MHQATQIELTQRLFEYIDSGSTATFDQAYEQPVTEYIDTDIAARENDLVGPLSRLSLTPRFWLYLEIDGLSAPQRPLM